MKLQENEHQNDKKATKLEIIWYLAWLVVVTWLSITINPFMIKVSSSYTWIHGSFDANVGI